jgi:hypothetical protein
MQMDSELAVPGENRNLPTFVWFWHLSIRMAGSGGQTAVQNITFMGVFMID